MKSNLDAIKNMDARELTWLLNCVFFTGVNLKVFQLCQEQGIEVPEFSLPTSLQDFSSKENEEDIVQNPFNEKWLESGNELVTCMNKNDLLPIPLGKVLLKMLNLTQEEYNESINR